MVSQFPRKAGGPELGVVTLEFGSAGGGVLARWREQNWAHNFTAARWGRVSALGGTRTVVRTVSGRVGTMADEVLPVPAGDIGERRHDLLATHRGGYAGGIARSQNACPSTRKPEAHAPRVGRHRYYG